MYKTRNLKIKYMRKVIFAIAAVAALASCAQKPMSPEERLKAFNEADSLMLVELQTTMESLAGDQEKAQAFYDEFIQRYIDFSLEAAAQNPDNQVSVIVLRNLKGIINDEQVSTIIENMHEELLQDELVVYMKKGLDARKATAEGMMFTDFTVEHVYDYDRSVEPQPLKKEVKFSDYVGKGTYVLVDFWSPWCGPCRREIPNIQTVYEQYKDKDLQVLSLAVWERKPQLHTIETAAQLGMDWFHINNCGHIPTDIYGIEGIPHLMLIGPDGTILKRGFHGLEGIQAAVAEFIR